LIAIGTTSNADMLFSIATYKTTTGTSKGNTSYKNKPYKRISYKVHGKYPLMVKKSP